MALRRELGQRGVGREEISAALAERQEAAEQRARDWPSDYGDEPSGSPDEAAARRLIERRRRELDRIDDPRTRRERAYALLARNGFDPDVCRTVAASVAPPGTRP